MLPSAADLAWASSCYRAARRSGSGRRASPARRAASGAWRRSSRRWPPARRRASARARRSRPRIRRSSSRAGSTTSPVQPPDDAAIDRGDQLRHAGGAGQQLRRRPPGHRASQERDARPRVRRPAEGGPRPEARGGQGPGEGPRDPDRRGDGVLREAQPGGLLVGLARAVARGPVRHRRADALPPPAPRWRPVWRRRHHGLDDPPDHRRLRPRPAPTRLRLRPGPVRPELGPVHDRRAALHAVLAAAAVALRPPAGGVDPAVDQPGPPAPVARPDDVHRGHPAGRVLQGP